jgi:hypothetical protein
MFFPTAHPSWPPRDDIVYVAFNNGIDLTKSIMTNAICPAHMLEQCF